jgi:hypothetical protein
MPRKVTVDDMVNAIEDAERPCTKQDIADRTGVTRPTIINYEDELKQDPRVEFGKVGSATAYWSAKGPAPTQPPAPEIRDKTLAVAVSFALVFGWGGFAFFTGAFFLGIPLLYYPSGAFTLIALTGATVAVIKSDIIRIRDVFDVAEVLIRGEDR